MIYFHPTAVYSSKENYNCFAGFKKFTNAMGKQETMNARVYSEMIKNMKNRGDANDPRLWAEYVLDDDCCIVCDFTTALEIMLTNSSVGLGWVKDEMMIAEQIIDEPQAPKKKKMEN